MTLTIYGCYRSRATRTIWLANELGLDFTLAPVIQAYRLADPNAADAPLHTRSQAFLAINPNGHIPSIDDDGFVLHESLAINLYLSRKHGGPLATANAQEEGLAAMWSLWAATEVEEQALSLRDAAKANAARESLRAPLAVLDAALAGKDYLVGGRFTVADINVAEVVRYVQAAPDLFEPVPEVTRWLAACQARPAFKAMWAAREAEPA